MSSRRVYSPDVIVEQIVHWGPEPVGASQALGLQGLYGLTQRGVGAKNAVRAGNMDGDPANSFYGDLGPVQRFTRLRVAAAKRARRNGIMETQAFPSSSGTSGIQDSLGALGL
jgi:hypothetical protein